MAGLHRPETDAGVPAGQGKRLQVTAVRRCRPGLAAMWRTLPESRENSMLHDDLLGELEWNPRWKEWDGRAEVSDQCVSLEVSPLDGQADAAALAAARIGLLWV